METLVVAEHRNQYCGRVKSWGPGLSTTSPSRNFKHINCRTFEYGVGILPTPKKGFTSPGVKRPSRMPAFSLYATSLKSSSPNANHVATEKNPKKNSRSSPISIGGRSTSSKKHTNLEYFHQIRSFSDPELWAGPTYSNSPPPSSVPIPKFSLQPKRTVSLDLSYSESAVDLPSTAISAPSSPTRVPKSSRCYDFSLSADSATKTLRRMLNLDSGKE